MANHAYGQTPNKFRFETEFNEISRLRVTQNFFRGFQWVFSRGKSNCRFSQPLANDFLEPAKRAADNEQNMLRINRAGRFATALSEVHHRLDLPRNVIW